MLGNITGFVGEETEVEHAFCKQIMLVMFSVHNPEDFCGNELQHFVAGVPAKFGSSVPP